MSTLMCSDLGLDPSDPLNLLLHNHSQHDDPSPTDAAPPDWNSLSSMWPEDKMEDMSHFTMDLDAPDFGLFNPFQFTFAAPSPLPESESDSGGSSASFSPPPSMRAASEATAYDGDDPAAELANRVRKSAGVVLAVQIGADPQYQPHQPSAFTAPASFASYPADTPAFTSAPVAPATPATPLQSAQTRPKTSHTTIERRYRTNLNARIQSLRQAVPALRVVDKAAAIKAGEASPGGDSDPEDHIDARGFVDGVKIARKCSKANVLGKAVEYIRVLKNREKRLTRELDGLKTLLRGLVGGTEMLGAWEREWVGMFGGGERDEVGVEDGAHADDGEDDEEGESDEEGGRKRKKARVEAPPKAKVERKPAAPAQEGEKKKRGRPRKVVPLPASANASHAGSPALSTSVPMHSSLASTAAYAERHQEIMQQHQQRQDLGPRQYLLGAFALFSFFANANVASPASSTPHQGHVLTPVGIAGKVYGVDTAGGMGLLQAFHLLASAAVLVSVVWPVGRGMWGRYVAARAPTAPTARAEKPVVGETAASAEEEEGSETETERSSSSVGSVSEEDADADASEEEGQAQAQAQAQRAAEACILDDATPLTTRLRTALRLYAASPAPAPFALSATEEDDDPRRLLALLVRPVPLLGARVAARLWPGVDAAARRLAPLKHTRPGVRVLRALAAGAALERLRAVAGRAFVREVLGSCASTSTSTSTGTPSPGSDKDADADSDALAKAAAAEREQAKAEERERAEALEGARRLGGRIARLGARVGRVVGGSSRSAVDLGRGGDASYDDDAQDEGKDGEQEGEGAGAGAEVDVEKLLRAIVLYRRVFGASPSASAGASANANAKAKGGTATSEAARALRRTLGSSEVFEDAGVEEARDRVVDLLTGEA
ncbi:hypothetical protein C8F04DRAFT_1400498 [Mycena alexandri]|uniref:BHLH domain-containing protein n=1 Tax=Mycena alexandri TaxID=1745969 RepID=A0AAD6SE27_9AGAR|nr:hypothetical protein C8F04DRAFT_1400498 [Mycena alexandri]